MIDINILRSKINIKNIVAEDQIKNGTQIMPSGHNTDRVNLMFRKIYLCNEMYKEYCLDSIFSKLSKEELSILEIYIINNHSNSEINKDYLDNITILRPDFSTGHLSRNWNQAIINVFQNLKNPDYNIVITNQNDIIFRKFSDSVEDFGL